MPATWGTRSRNYSESTAELIDSEVRFLVDSAYERAMAILTENRDKLDILTEALMEFETLEGSQVMDILEYGEEKPSLQGDSAPHAFRSGGTAREG